VNVFRGQAAIVGVADEVSPTGEIGMSGKGAEAQMIKRALDEAGLSVSDVDGVACATGAGFAASMELAEYMGVQPAWTDSTSVGGSSFEVHTEHAAAAIALGMCEVAVIA
jgi:3-oxoacyl-[acyl-carrier-protein] synthase III